MREESLPPWRTHDWKVRTIESIAPGGGSRLVFISAAAAGTPIKPPSTAGLGR